MLNFSANIYEPKKEEKRYILPSGWNAPFGYNYSCEYWKGKFDKDGIPLVKYGGRYVPARAWRLWLRGEINDMHKTIEMGCGHERCVSIEHMIR